MNTTRRNAEALERCVNEHNVSLRASARTKCWKRLRELSKQCWRKRRRRCLESPGLDSDGSRFQEKGGSGAYHAISEKEHVDLRADLPSGELTLLDMSETLLSVDLPYPSRWPAVRLRASCQPAAGDSLALQVLCRPLGQAEGSG